MTLERVHRVDAGPEDGIRSRRRASNSGANRPINPSAHAFPARPEGRAGFSPAPGRGSRAHAPAPRSLIKLGVVPGEKECLGPAHLVGPGSGAAAFRCLTRHVGGVRVLQVRLVSLRRIPSWISSSGHARPGRTRPCLPPPGLLRRASPPGRIRAGDIGRLSRSHLGPQNAGRGGAAGATFTANETNTSGTLIWTPGVGQAGVYDVVFMTSESLEGTASTRITVDSVSAVGTSEPPAVPRAVFAKPNPFERATVFAVRVPNSGRVIGRVYDISGRLIRTLVDEDRPRGSLRVTWNGETDRGIRAASGTYFCWFTLPDGTRRGQVVRLIR